MISLQKIPLQFYTYVFIPKDVKITEKYPLIVLPHSGIHADFSTYYAHIVRELIAQGYVVVSAEYRGSTGYGRDTYENIDYGGLENEDVMVSRDYMLRKLQYSGQGEGCYYWLESRRDDLSDEYTPVSGK